MSNSKILLLLMGAIACIGFAWQYLIPCVSPCSQCVEFNKKWRKKNKSEIIKAYGIPASVFPTEAEIKKGYGTHKGRDLLQIWKYDSPEIIVTVKISDETIYSAYLKDHKCPFSLWGI